MSAKAGLNPTEDLEKVIKSLSNLFNYDELEIGENCVTVSGGLESFFNWKKSLEKRRIRSTARKILIKGVRRNMIFFRLNKQAAFVGVSNFVEGKMSPLGDIEVKVECSDPEAFIDWIAPEINV
jgi:Uncharacterized protein conserved in archaea